jgi:hypothetical protein
MLVYLSLLKQLALFAKKQKSNLCQGKVSEGVGNNLNVFTPSSGLSNFEETSQSAFLRDSYSIDKLRIKILIIGTLMDIKPKITTVSPITTFRLEGVSTWLKSKESSLLLPDR